MVFLSGHIPVFWHTASMWLQILLCLKNGQLHSYTPLLYLTQYLPYFLEFTTYTKLIHLSVSGSFTPLMNCTRFVRLRYSRLNLYLL